MGVILNEQVHTAQFTAFTGQLRHVKVEIYDYLIIESYLRSYCHPQELSCNIDTICISDVYRRDKIVFVGDYTVKMC